MLEDHASCMTVAEGVQVCVFACMHGEGWVRDMAAGFGHRLGGGGRGREAYQTTNQTTVGGG